jgi:hypothetical protein
MENNEEEKVVGMDGEPIPEPKTDAEIAQAVIADISIRRSRGEVIDIIDYIRLDCDRMIQKFMVENKICTQREWNALANGVRIGDAHGGNPKTSLAFVALVAAKEKITFRLNGLLHHDRPPVLELDDGTSESAYLDPEDPEMGDIYDAMGRIMFNPDMTTADFGRLLRLANDDHRVGFDVREIDDALGAWLAQEREKALWECYSGVGYSRGVGTGPAGREAWQQLATRLFDCTDAGVDFVVSVLKKFIWQVKRKMLGLPVTDHLMPVILGPQGVGKSTFVRRLLEPISDVYANTDFAAVSDARNIELWAYFVLFLDEMGHATKADIDATKFCISADRLDRRPMHTNRTVQIKNCATFIGCSNKELDQLIRDETGGRRFVAIRFRHEPDWDYLNALNIKELLWPSVNEKGDDPMRAQAATLKRLQDDQREKSSVEIWVRQARTTTGWHSAASLYGDFHAWEDGAFRRKGTDLAAFGKEITRLLNTHRDLPLGEKRRTGRGVEYRWEEKV